MQPIALRLYTALADHFIRNLLVKLTRYIKTPALATKDELVGRLTTEWQQTWQNNGYLVKDKVEEYQLKLISALFVSYKYLLLAGWEEEAAFEVLTKQLIQLQRKTLRYWSRMYQLEESQWPLLSQMIPISIQRPLYHDFFVKMGEPQLMLIVAAFNQAGAQLLEQAPQVHPQNLPQPVYV